MALLTTVDHSQLRHPAVGPREGQINYVYRNRDQGEWKNNLY